MRKNDFTTYEISKICGVSMPTIIGWIKQDKLKAFKTVGGHRRVKKEDLLDFLRKHEIPVPMELIRDDSWKILVVDDDTDLVNFMVKAINEMEEKHEVKISMDGFDAGKQVQAFKPHLVILDLMLPGVNGFEVCKNIRGDKSTKDIRILAITGYDTEENKRRIFECGADMYLTKPFAAGDLKEKISILLKK